MTRSERRHEIQERKKDRFIFTILCSALVGLVVVIGIMFHCYCTEKETINNIGNTLVAFAGGISLISSLAGITEVVSVSAIYSKNKYKKIWVACFGTYKICCIIYLVFEGCYLLTIISNYIYTLPFVDDFDFIKRWAEVFAFQSNIVAFITIISIIVMCSVYRERVKKQK